MHQHNTVVKLLQMSEGPCLPRSPNHLQIKVLDLLSQCIPINPEEFRGANLVAARCGERRSDERAFNLAKDTMVESRRG
jgi:hypothetical protein